jgi:RND family efflux transporter MFP subunit
MHQTDTSTSTYLQLIMHKHSIPAIVFCCLLFFLAPALAEQPEKNQTHNLPAKAVHAIEINESSTLPQVELVATIEAVEQAQIAAKVTGTIIELPVVLGSRVNKGDLLVRISAEEISARVLQAQAQLAQAKRNLSREEKLLKRNATTRETVNSLRDLYAVAKASLKEAQTMLGYTTITAPFDGVITKKMANSGNLATPGTPLLKLENNTRLQAVTAVPESLIKHLKTGEMLRVAIASAALSLSGSVAEIAPAADPGSRTAPVKIDIAYHPALRTGQFARVLLPLAPAKSLFIPVSAVVSFGQMDKVFVIEDNRASLRLVRTGAESDKHVEILAGLSAGDMVITDNNSLLVSGQPVTIIQ